MNTDVLKTFIILSELKNFTRTADQMFVAQSTVTNRISELEREIGKNLFVRGKKGVQLTREGALFLNYAQKIVELEESYYQELNTTQPYRTFLRIGTTATIYDSWLDSLIDYCNEPGKQVAINVNLDHSQTLLMQIQDYLYDIVFTYYPLNKAGFSCEIFHTDDLVLVTSPRNERFASGIRKEELTQIAYLMNNFALQDVGLFVRELFPSHYQFRFQTDNGTIVPPILLRGIGYSFLPRNLVREYLQNGQLISIPLLDFETPKVTSYCVYRNNAEGVQDLIGFLKSHF